MSILDKLKDAATPFDNIGAEVVKGGLGELIKAAKDYPVLAEGLKGKKIKLVTVTTTETTMQLEVLEG